MATNDQSSPQRSVLHVGCGAKTITGMPLGFRDGSWTEVRFDIDENVRPDIVGTITDMAAVASESVDAVFSSHNLEHVFPHEVHDVLSEFRRVLKPSGFVVVTCPDLQSVAEHIVADRLNDPLYVSSAGPITPLDILYGHIDSIQNGRVYMAHRTGFTRKTLQEYASRAGFAALGLRRRPAAYDLWLIGTKTPADEDAIKALMNAYAGG